MLKIYLKTTITTCTNFKNACKWTQWTW